MRNPHVLSLEIIDEDTAFRNMIFFSFLFFAGFSFGEGEMEWKGGDGYMVFPFHVVLSKEEEEEVWLCFSFFGEEQKERLVVQALAGIFFRGGMRRFAFPFFGFLLF